MKKAICFVIFAILFCGLAPSAEASKLEIGAKFDIEKLAPNKKPADSTIVAFMPSLTYDCEYASMLTQSFYFYFDRQMAFDQAEKKPRIQVILVVRDRRNEAKSAQNILGDMNVVYDEKGEIFSHFGIQAPFGKNANSTVVLLDNVGKIKYFDTAYRAQGERLKPLEARLKEAVGIRTTVDAATKIRPLKVGDKAPDFLIKEGQRLSDLRGEVVLVSFYPAAFSGAFPKPYDVETIEVREITLKEPTEAGGVPAGFTVSAAPNAGPRPFLIKPESLTSCVLQIGVLDIKPGPGIKTAKRILITSSTGPLLREWQKALDTTNIIYANDPDYTVSKQYSSYSPYGFNNRVSVIVDQKGRIAYIDDSFEVADEVVIEGKINELLKKK